jgi:hypothetical protein
MEQNNTSTPKSSNGKGLGIAGLVLGILAAIISFIPCLGVYALLPGIVGIVLSAISMMQANKAAASKSLAIAGLICSIVGCCIAGWQYYQLKTVGDNLKEGLEQLEKSGALDSLNHAMDQLKDLTDTTKTH